MMKTFYNMVYSVVAISLMVFMIYQMTGEKEEKGLNRTMQTEKQCDQDRNDAEMYLGIYEAHKKWDGKKCEHIIELNTIDGCMRLRCEK